MAKTDRVILVTNDQQFGQVADPNKLENMITHAYDKIDENDTEFVNHKKQVDPSSADTTRDKHVSNNDLKGLQDQITTNLTNLTDHKKQVDPTSSDTTRDKHVANNDLKTLQDQITTNNTASLNRDNTHKNAVVLDHPDQSVTTEKLKDYSVTGVKIANGAVSRNQLDPTLFEQTANASKFQEIDAQLADIAINVKTFGAKGDGVTDDTVAIQNAIDYAYNNRVGKVFLPKGVYVISKPLYLWGSYSGDDPTTVLCGDSINTTMIKKTTHNTLNDGSNYATIDAILILANKDKDTSRDTCGQMISDLTLSGTINYSGNDFVEYGIYAKSSVAYTKIENVLIDVTNTGIRFEANYWQNQIRNVVMYVRKKGLSIALTGTSNYLEKMFVVAATEIAYELKGIYSAASSLTAQHCSGIIFDISWGDWAIDGIGEEDSQNATAIVKTQEANVTLSGVTFFGNKAANSVVVQADNNSVLTINGGTIGTGITSLGKLFETKVNAKLALNNVRIKDTYTLSSSDGGAQSSVSIKNDYSTPINLSWGNKRPFIGVDRRRRKNLDYFNTTPKLQGKAIFLSCKDSPLFNTDGTDLQWDATGNQGDIFLVDDPKKKGTLGWVITSDTSDVNGPLKDCTFAPIPLALGGTTADRPASPVRGSLYFDTDLGKYIYYNGTIWKDFNHCRPENKGSSVWAIGNSSTFVVTFANAEENGSYAPHVVPRWNTTWWITNKSSTGFTINFGTPPTTDTQFDWAIRR